MGRAVTNRNDVQTVLDHRTVDDATGCWNWTGYIQTTGYGQIEVCGRLWLAHRFSWAMHHRGIEPWGMLVLHKCDNPKCVNPDHLFIGTHQDNVDDMWSKGRGHRGPHKNPATKPRQRKLTDDAVRDIRSGRLTDKEFMRLYSAGRTTVGDIRRGKTKALVK